MQRVKVLHEPIYALINTLRIHKRGDDNTVLLLLLVLILALVRRKTARLNFLLDEIPESLFYLLCKNMKGPLLPTFFLIAWYV